ncbi:MAG: hypothetical protein ACP5GF_13225 [Thiomonas sp.]
MARPERSREEAAEPKADPDAIFKTTVRARYEQAEREAYQANPAEAARHHAIANACAGLLRVL